jgi:ribosomal protein L11 methyltransferase
LAGYLEIEITLARPPATDHERMLAYLSQYAFEGFREEEGRILAYIREDSWDGKGFQAFLEQYRLHDSIESLETRRLPDRNWNELWESNYPPVRLGSECLIRAPFHAPEAGVAYDIVISPKMSFGTAHHETTKGMLQMMFTLELKGKAVLDLGCGTGILAILAEKMGAASVLALDNDPWAYRNALENLALNACSRIRVQQAELSFITHPSFDLILANINLNSLLDLMDQFPVFLQPGGILILSGFLSGDQDRIGQAAGRNGLVFVVNQVMNNWTVAVYRKAV